MFNHTISAILRGGWLIDKGYADAHIPLVLGLLTGKLNGSEFLSGDADFQRPFIINSNGSRVDVFSRWGNEINDDAIEPGSVLVMPFTSPIMKYDGSCGEYGNIRRSAWINGVKGNPNIVGFVSILDTPGGQADGTPQMADLIKSLDIPTAAVISGGAYSAGAWIASGHQHIYAGDKHAGFGSIGAYTTVADYRGYFKNMGIDVQDVYPDESRDKNAGYRKAISGDISEVKESVAKLARSFITEFSANRTGRLTSDAWQTGKTFDAPEAVGMGLIDGIKPLAEVARELQGKKIHAPASSKSKTSNSNMNFENVTALAGVENATDEQLDLANGDLTAAGVTGYTLVPESMITDASTVTAERDQLQQDLSAANTNTETAQSELTAANERVSALEAEIAELKKGAGATHTPASGTDDPVNTDDEDIDSILASLPHNQKADRMLG